MASNTFILGSPEFYNVEEAGGLNELGKKKAEEQFLRLEQHIESHGITVEVVPGDKEHYDSVYITNSALIINDFAIMARYSKPSRRGEEKLLAPYLKNKLGLRLRYLPNEDGLYFEGQGDCKFSHNNTHLWIGYGVGRTTLKGITAVEKILKEELGTNAPAIHPLRINDRVTFHLDLCLLPLPNGRVLYHSTLSKPAIRQLEYAFGEENLIKVPMKYFYACNSVVLDDKTLLTPRLGGDYRGWMYNAINSKSGTSKMKLDEVNVNQFHLGKGSVQCMILNMFQIPC